MKISLIALSVALVIIMILSGIIIFRKPEIQVAAPDESWKDTVANLHKQIELSHIRQAQLQNSYDSLSSLEPRVITRTHDKIKFIYSTATPDDLDSIIRTNWKTTSRYR